MDKIKDMAGKASGGGDKKAGGNSGPGQDYVDKGVEAGQKKFGMQSNPQQTEKMTDAAREQFEKRTGKDIPDKVSN